MKKFFFLIIILFLFPLGVGAESCDSNGIVIKEVSLEKLSEEVEELSPPSVDDNIIKLNLKMKEVGDYANYKVTIKNNTDETYQFNPNSLVVNSSFINYSFDIKNNKVINPHQTIEVHMIVQYNKKVSANSFDNGVFHEQKKIITTLKEFSLVNPNTGVAVFGYILLIAIVLLFSYLFGKNKKAINIILLILCALVPISAYCLCDYEINVEANVEIEEYNGRTFYHVSGDDSLLDNISSKNVSSNQGIDFSAPSSDSNGKGIYVRSGTENDQYPIYYYRGNVTNNNVLFGGFCWKILRTTSTGGVKLIYNGVSENGSCDNNGDDTLISSGVKWGLSGNLSYFGYAYQAGHAFKNIKITAIPNGAVFAEDVSYKNGKYIFNNEKYIKDANLANAVDENLQNHHYSCFKTENDECTTVNYVYMTRGGYLYYIILDSGDTIDKALEKDLFNSSNTVDSNIKTVVENWFESNLVEETDLLEDTEWCNDRTIGSYGAWNKHGSLDDKVLFGGLYRAMNGTPKLTCTNRNDRFTTSEENGNGLARYPIGLITLDEAMLAGFAWNQDDESNYLYNGKVWWTMTPSLISVQLDYIGVLHSMADNVTTVYVTGGAGGVRPSISLNHSARISGGDGSVDNPFIVLKTPSNE